MTNTATATKANDAMGPVVGAVAADAADAADAAGTASGTAQMDFPVVWADPADAEGMWVWEAEHAPLPLSPLSVDFFATTLRIVQELRGLRAREHWRSMFVNGFYYGLHSPKPDPDAPPDPVLEERKQRDAALGERLAEVWGRELEPEIRGLCHGVRDRDFKSLSAAQIADLLDSCVADAARAFAITNGIAAPGMGAAVRPFTAFLKEAFPGENAEALAGVMLGGFANYTAQSEVEVWRLARRAERVPAVKRAILAAPPGEVAGALARLPEAAAFRRAVDAYLAFYGWRPELWFELTLPTWAEDPSALFGVSRGYRERPTAEPRRAQRRAASRRRRTVARCRARLDAEQRERFDALLARAQQYVPVRENRALWQLSTTGVLRVPCLALGRALCAAGLLAAPDDVFFLRLDELRQLGREGRLGVTGGLDHRALVTERRAERERWLHVTPPLVLGTLDPSVRDEVAAGQGRFAELGFEQDTEGGAPILRGGAASRGVARGRARVVRSLAEADTLGPGEILVCRSTSPAWTPLVARAAAVVADTGGVLAHCAIVAREHAIPCVVGTGMATQRIQDGMLVTVDGTRGVVRLDGAVGGWAEPAARGVVQTPGAAETPTRGEAPAERAETRVAGGDDGGGDGAWIAWLGDGDCHETRRTGGKAASLSRLAASYRVPPGFCLTAAAYERAHRLAGDADASAGGPVPEALRRALCDAYTRLADRCGEASPAVAVRSSAIDEDGRESSFAGQHETILNVVGEAALAEAVARCWRSLRAAGALAYRAARGLTTDGARLAVLVQQLVPADAAGVLFTAHPVTGSREEALLTTSYGLGESIVSGTVTPDTYVIRKDGGAGEPAIVSRELGEKDVMTVLAPAGEQGTREVPVPPTLRTRPAVEEAQVLEAVRLGLALEAETGWPVDVELAWKDGVLYLLQCRPITTLRT